VISSAVGEDFWLKKYSSAGAEHTSWDVGSGTTYADQPHGLAIDGNDDVYVAGYADAPRFGSDLGDWYIDKFDASGL